jgi:CRP-like cAMP-binding protein
MPPHTDILSLIRQYAYRQAIPANTWLFRQGEPLRDLYLLEAGLVKMLRLEANGCEDVVELRSAGSLVGATSAIANTPAPMTAITCMESTVVRLPVNDFLQMARSSTDVSHELLVFICWRSVEQSICHSRQKAFSSRVRLAQLFLWLTERFGAERSGEVRLASPLSKQEMAAWVGASPQHLSVVLGEMKRDGLIDEVGGWLIFRDLQRLIYEAETGEKCIVRPLSLKGQ